MGNLVHHGHDLHTARATLVVLHGRGQTPDDMTAMLVGRLSLPGVAVLMPVADGASWYAARAVDPMTAATAAALDAALMQVAALVAVGTGPVFLAGFSQGACVALEYALRGGAGLSAVAALTGSRVGTGAIRPRTPLVGLPVLLTGSDADPWIPVSAFADAVGELATAGARLRAEVLPGRGHEIADAEVAIVQAMLDVLHA